MSSEPLCYICPCKKMYDLDQSFHGKTITCQNCSTKAHIEIIDGALVSNIIGHEDLLGLEEVEVKKKKKEPQVEEVTKKGWGKKQKPHLSDIKREQVQRIQKEKIEAEEEIRKESKFTRCPNCRDKGFDTSKACLKCHYTTFGYYDKDIKPMLVEYAISFVCVTIVLLFAYSGYQNGLTNRPTTKKQITDAQSFKFEEKSKKTMKLFFIKANIAQTSNNDQEEFSTGIIIEKGKCLIKAKHDPKGFVTIHYDKRKRRCKITNVEKWDATTKLVTFDDPKSSRDSWEIKQTPPINKPIEIIKQVNQLFFINEKLTFYKPLEFNNELHWPYHNVLFFDYKNKTIFLPIQEIKKEAKK